MYSFCVSLYLNLFSHICVGSHTHMHKNYLKIKIMKNSSTISEFSDQLQRNSQMNKLWSFKVRLKSKMKNQKPLNKKNYLPFLVFFLLFDFFQLFFFSFPLILICSIIFFTFFFIIFLFFLFSLHPFIYIYSKD